MLLVFSGNALTEKQWESIIDLITLISEVSYLNCKLITSPDFITANLKKILARGIKPSSVTNCKPAAQLLLIGIESDIRKTPGVVEQDKVDVYQRLLALGETANVAIPMLQINKENVIIFNLFNKYVFTNFEQQNMHRTFEQAQGRVEEILKFISSIQELSQSGSSQKVSHTDSFMRSIRNVKALVHCKELLQLNFCKIYWYWKLLRSLQNQPELPSNLETIYNLPLWGRQANILRQM